MRLLLTGATGFVGRNFLLTAIRSGRYDEIIVPIRSYEKLLAQFHGDGFDAIPKVVTPISCSAHDWDFSSVGPLDQVVHSAGVVQAHSRRAYFQTNVEGTIRLFSSLPTAKKIVVLSSQAAAGPTGTGQSHRTETDSESPVTWYGESKLEMEKRLAAEFSHLPYLCLRPPMLFGPRDQMTLPLFKMAKGWFHFKPGRRPKYYSFLAVEDLIAAIVTALSDPSDWAQFSARNLFVASAEEVSDLDLLQTAADACGTRGIRVFVPETLIRGVSRIVDVVPKWREALPMLTVDRSRDIWPERWVCSSEVFSKRFAWSAQKDFRTTVRETCDWYVKTGQL